MKSAKKTIALDTDRAIGFAITRILAGDDEADALLESIKDLTGRAHRVGITGSPGVGKSTLVAAIARQIVDEKEKVGVVAVDPRSPYSGGAFLGDRVRLAGFRLAAEPAVFFRSLAFTENSKDSREETSKAADVLDAAGFPWIFMETVGVGQSEVSIRDRVDTVVLILSPGQGDEIQLLKAGILEIADIFVINRKDSSGSEKFRGQLEDRVRFKRHSSSDWIPPVLMAEALRAEGVVELLDQLKKHRQWKSQALTSAERNSKS